MKEVTVKRVDKLGRIVLPAEYRQTMGISPGTKVVLSSDNDRITIQLLMPRCKICGSTENVDETIPLCKNCLKKAKSRKI